MSQVQTPKFPYQGYPYVNPRVIDAPSLSPSQVAELAKWQNLPRRPWGEGSRDNVSNETSTKEDEDRPVVYIDIPEGNGSDVSESIRDTEPTFVQETIFYDPFKDRRIRVPNQLEGDAGPSSSARPSRPQPPSTLNLNSPGSSGPSTTQTPTPVPSFLSKETYVYGNQSGSDDGFPLSPIPVTEFPAPPPPYEEVPSGGERPPAPQPEEPPRTQVIVPPSPPSIVLERTRKLATCQHCHTTVQTIVVKQNGFWTHIMACIMCIVFMPVVWCVYCFDACKYKVHLCPNCNKEITKEPPEFCGNEFS